MEKGGQLRPPKTRCEEVDLHLHRIAKLHIGNMAVKPRACSTNIEGVDDGTVLHVGLPRFLQECAVRDGHIVKPLVMELVMDVDGDLSHEGHPEPFRIRRIPMPALEKTMMLVAPTMQRAAITPTISFLPAFLFRHGGTPPYSLFCLFTTPMNDNRPVARNGV